MATITFKAKVEKYYCTDDTLAQERIKVPVIKRSHCDMHAFRLHPKYGSYANSDLFQGILARIRKDYLGDYVWLGRVPEDVTIDLSGFLATVTLEV